MSHFHWHGGFFGLALIGLTVGGDLTGDALSLALGGAFSWAVGNVLVKRLGPLPMLPLMAWLSLVPPLPSLVVAWLLYPTGPSLPTAIIHASYESLLAILYIGVVATVIAYAMWGGLLARYSTAVVAPFALLVIVARVVTFASRERHFALAAPLRRPKALFQTVWATAPPASQQSGSEITDPRQRRG